MPNDFDVWMAAEGERALRQAFTHPSLAPMQVRVLLEKSWLKGVREGMDLSAKCFPTTLAPEPKS